jgi:hypothetical protein
VPGNPSDAQRYLRVSELMYHPANPPITSPYNDDDFEFIEFINTGTRTIDLYGVTFSDGIAMTVPTHTMLGPLDCAVLIRNPEAFATRYDTNGMRIAGIYSNAFNNAGERVAYVDAFGEDVLEFEFDDAWYPSTDGDGYALEAVDLMAPRHTWSVKEAWSASEVLHGTPGYLVPEPHGVVFLVAVASMYHRRATPGAR